MIDHSLLPAGSRVLCAVSGGADSVCLLSLLRERADLTVLCAHYNHRLRGAESDRDEVFVRDLCARWGVPCHAGGGDVAAYAAQRGLGTEEAARELRYAFLQKTAGETGADCIATAHTMNDNAETVLLNLARGTGLRGLCGIPPRRGNIVRPLLGATRRQVEAYLTARDIPWVEDSTNRTDDYARNRARHHVLPGLEELHAGAVENIGRMTDALREDEEYLSGEARAFREKYPPDRLPVRELLALPAPVRNRVLGQAAGGSLGRDHRQMLLALCRSADPSGECDVPGLRVRREYDWLIFGGGEEAKLPDRTLTVGRELLLPEAGLAVFAKNCLKTNEVQSSFNTFCFSCANIYGKISVTSRREGDKLLLAGRNGTRSVKKWMIDARIPRARRALVPVLRDDAGILAVYGMGQSARAVPKPGEPYIKIEIREIVGGTEE